MRGDCHLHTVHSDGKRLPGEAAVGARAAGLDFIVSTDHNTPGSHGVWGEYAGPDLLVVPGEQGNSDAHSDPQVIGLPHNVVRADDLTTDAIMEGIRSGHGWIAESASVELAFTATGDGGQAGIGETLKAPADAPVDVRLDVWGVPHGTVRFITDEGQMHQESLDASGTGTVMWRTTASLASYARAEVRHPMADGSPGQGNTMGEALLFGPMAALTNPVFLTATTAPHS
jgi:hypothetical protein